MRGGVPFHDLATSETYKGKNRGEGVCSGVWSPGATLPHRPGLLSRCSLHPSAPDPEVLSFLQTRVKSDSLLWIALLLRVSDLGQDVTSVLQPLLCSTNAPFSWGAGETARVTRSCRAGTVPGSQGTLRKGHPLTLPTPCSPPHGLRYQLDSTGLIRILFEKRKWLSWVQGHKVVTLTLLYQPWECSQQKHERVLWGTRR